MTIRGAIRDRPVTVLYGLIVVSLAGLLPLPPLLQDQSYHQFADQRELFGIPNFWNVVSNLPFVAEPAYCDFVAMQPPLYSLRGYF
jgi:hypothetical protein